MSANATASLTSVYRYYDRYGILIYAGITARGHARAREHSRDKGWWQYVASQDVEHFPTRQQALDREAHLIQTYRPPFNTVLNPDRDSVSRYESLVGQIPDRTPLEHYREIGNRWQLGIADRDENSITFITRPYDWPCARTAQVGKGARINSPEFGNVGHLMDATPHGACILIAAQIRKRVENISRAELDVKYDPNAGRCVARRVVIEATYRRDRHQWNRNETAA